MLVSFHRLVSANRWPVDNHPEVLRNHWLGFKSFSWSNSLLHCFITWIVTSSQISPRFDVTPNFNKMLYANLFWNDSNTLRAMSKAVHVWELTNLPQTGARQLFLEGLLSVILKTNFCKLVNLETVMHLSAAIPGVWPRDIRGNSAGFAGFCRQCETRDGGIGSLLHFRGKIHGERPAGFVRTSPPSWKWKIRTTGTVSKMAMEKSKICDRPARLPLFAKVYSDLCL